MVAGSSFNIWKSLRGLPRGVWILAAATLVNRVGTMVLPFLVLYLTRELGWSAARAGIALGVYGVGSIIAAPLAGKLSDRIGPMPIMQGSLIAGGVLLLLYPLVDSFAAVIALTLVWAIVTESFRPANMACVADLVTPEQRKPAYALLRLAINLGMSVGPAAAGFIAARSFGWIFIADAVSTLAAGFVLIMLPITAMHCETPDETSQQSRAASSRRLLILEDKRFALFLSAIFLTGVVFFQHEGALPLFLVDDLHFSPAFYGLLFTVNTVMIVFMEVPLNAATAHWEHRRGLALGAALFALGSGMFAIAEAPVAIIAGIVVWTVGEMLLFPQAAAYVSDIAPQARRGEYMGIYALSFNVAFAIGPWAGTAALAAYGARAMWIGVFLVGIIAAVLMARVSVTQTTAATAPA
ncbi:MAG TPA: MFS transporter [Gemmatimonadaceae bacterium]|nr:MFS transporter [Gemmatimonadaceae bacterium]